jgi:hypothetical protein
MVQGLEAIHWPAPWLAPWRNMGQPLSAQVLAGMSVAHALTTQVQKSQASCPVRFVPQTDLPAGVAYEQHIFDTHQVPTRDSPHDFFNGLCWLHFPQTKQRLNALQVSQHAARSHHVRGAVGDALTIFDENAAFLWAPDGLWQALVTRQWHRLFVEQRTLWAHARLVLFGHALLEKLLQPRKAITAHVYRVLAPEMTHQMADADARQQMDAWVAQDLQPEKLLTKPFAPLPVLGVPGWWDENENPVFYEDKSVFRPAARLGLKKERTQNMGTFKAST